ncbi:hypothetical protein F2P81_025455 [Scophthalmus maximus]|uniref:Uncharacterized protein n=1 Tax=Scophthalmus maximus TaxID=52904 RepID=A0A6A4RPP8_SCOMX|nr:hypothetical protein F2P81_025455 [Scophthalmus maximus]
MDNCVKLAMLGRISIATQLDEGHRVAIRRHNEEVDRNLHILSKIIDAVKFCGAFELALRGHDESDTSENPGIFLGLIDLMASIDHELEVHLENVTVFKGTSKTVQNELLDCMLIDWAEEGPTFHSDPDDSSDEEYLPPISLRMGGALKGAQVIDNLPTIGIDETVHDLPAPEVLSDKPLSLEQPILSGPQKVLSEDVIVGIIISENSLRQLVTFLTLPVHTCTGVLRNGLVCDSVAPFSTNIAIRGTAMSVEWATLSDHKICPNGHCLWRWNSQSVLMFGMQAGGFLLSTNILLSGNNYAKIALLLKFMNIRMVNPNTHFTTQDTYCVDTIKEYWEEKSYTTMELDTKEIVHVATIDKRQTNWNSNIMEKEGFIQTVEKLTKEIKVVEFCTDAHVQIGALLSDGRNDSPGHSAQYCSYTTMELDTKEIVHVATIDKRQTNWNSNIMEKEGFIQTVEKLTKELKVEEFSTDAHVQIGEPFGLGFSIMCATITPGRLEAANMITSKTLKENSGLRGIPRAKALVNIVLNKHWQKDIHKYLRFSWCCGTPQVIAPSSGSARIFRIQLTRHPEIIYTDFKELQRHFGIIKAVVYPPRGLFFPILPNRTAADNCVIGAENKSSSAMLHSEDL